MAEVLRLTLEARPNNATRWSTRKMAAKLGISNERVSVIWRTLGLAPHRAETFQLSTDPHFIEKVRDVVGLYMSPPQNALVPCVDEKSQCQALERSRPILPPMPGAPPTSQPRLLPPWHGHLVRRLGREHRQGLRPVQAPAQAEGVS